MKTLSEMIEEVEKEMRTVVLHTEQCKEGIGCSCMHHSIINVFRRACTSLATELLDAVTPEEAGLGYPLPEDYFLGKLKSECAKDGYNACRSEVIRLKDELLK